MFGSKLVAVFAFAAAAGATYTGYQADMGTAAVATAASLAVSNMVIGGAFWRMKPAETLSDAGADTGAGLSAGPYCDFPPRP